MTIHETLAIGTTGEEQPTKDKWIWFTHHLVLPKGTAKCDLDIKNIAAVLRKEQLKV